MSRFKGTIKELETRVKEQQQALDALQEENEQLQQKEAALLSSLVTLQCGMSALVSKATAGQQSSQDSSQQLVSGPSSGPHAQLFSSAGQQSPAHSVVQPMPAQPAGQNLCASIPEANMYLIPVVRPASATMPGAGCTGGAAVIPPGPCAPVSTPAVTGSLPAAYQEQQYFPASFGAALPDLRLAAAADAAAGLQAGPPQEQERIRLHEQKQQQVLATLEQMLQGAMQEVTSLAPSAHVVRQQASSGDGSDSSSSGGEQPPSSRLETLRALLADPERVQSYLALTTEERSKWLADTVRRLGLLLPKYDRVPSCRAELTKLTEQVVARGLTYAWLDVDFCTIAQIQLLNMETGQLEPCYPEGFWKFVAEGLQLTPQQKWALQALWRRMKGAQAVLLQQHDALLARLECLQQQQQQVQQLFAQQAHELPIMQLAQSLLRCRQQQQGEEGLPQSPQQQQQLQQQQQQQQGKTVTCSFPEQQQQQQQEQQQEQRLLLDAGSLVGEPLGSQAMLLPPPSSDQRRLEQHLAALRESVTLGEKLLAAQLMSSTTSKQLAQLLVLSWPFCPDSTAICDALDELGW